MTTTCPAWCTNGTSEYPCDGDHLRDPNNETQHPANGATFPIMTERGAIYPAVSAGLDQASSMGRGTFLNLWVTGAQLDGAGNVSLDFELNEAFDLAIDILERYELAIQEIPEPCRPDGHEVARDLLDRIDYHLKWRQRQHEPDQVIRRHKAEFEFDATADAGDVVLGQVAELVMGFDNAGMASESKPVEDGGDT